VVARPAQARDAAAAPDGEAETSAHKNAGADLAPPLDAADVAGHRVEPARPAATLFA
jgi:hypothetical protein